MTTALITGVTGQDGRYLADTLLARGYHVVGVARHTPTEPLPSDVEFHAADAGNAQSVDAILRASRPREIYHLAAETSVERSWDDPLAAILSAQGGASNVLDAVRRLVPDARVCVASSAEVFSDATGSPQDEHTPLAPGSPYGQGKAELLRVARLFRSAHGMHVSGAILYNHESPRRPARFVSRKVTRAAAAIAGGAATQLRLGNLDSRRDWGYAGDYVDAMWRMMQADAPDDYVVGTGVARTVAELCNVAFEHVGLDYREWVVSDPSLFRAVDSVALLANPTRARERLGWVAGTAFEALIAAMVDADVERLRRGEA